MGRYSYHPHSMKPSVFPSHKMRSRLFASLCAIGMSGSAFAAVAVSNLAETFGGSAGVFFPSPNFRAGAGFTVASGSDYELNSIQVQGFVAVGSASDLVMTLYSDNGSGLPGSALASLSLASQTFSLFTFEPASAFTLTAGATYLWGLELTNTGEFRVHNTASTAQSGIAGWSISNTAISSTDGGSSWTQFGDPSMFSVDATAVPEPSTAVMGLGAMVLLFGARRRR